MISFVGLLLISTFLCALVTGFVFTYAVIVMPGFAKLGDKEFITAFQVTDEVIQKKSADFHDRLDRVDHFRCRHHHRSIHDASLG